MTDGDRDRSGDDPMAPNEPLRARVGGRPMVRRTLGLAFLLVIPVSGQAPIEQFPSANGARFKQFPDSSGAYDQSPNSPNQKRMQALNAERQKALVSDTERLLKLARELNDEVAAGDSNRLSDEQVRKVGEIGKLAKSVKDKMSYTLGGYAPLNTSLTIPPGDR